MTPHPRHIAAVATAALLASLTAFSSRKDRQSPISVSLVPDSIPAVETIDERYLSYNVEIAAVIGGNFWKPYTLESIAAVRAKARAAAASVTGGPGAQLGQYTTMYQARTPIDLTNARAANAQFVTSFAITPGVRDAAGVWTPVQARKLVDYTNAIGGHIAAAEFFNEPDMPTYVGAPRGYDAAAYARDHAAFVRFARTAAPNMRIVGPRHLVFSPNGQFVYLVDELDAKIRVFRYSSASGTLAKEMQVASALPKGFSGRPWAADIHLTPNGRYLYSSERTTSTPAALRVDPNNGSLTSIGSYPTARQPRAFSIDLSGRYLLSVGDLSDSMTAHSIDQTSGKLTVVREYRMGKRPNWVAIVQLP